ncbi:MAG: hypothetical protein DWQ02_11395 [Bacteroidetes bacterium]|nr:MAG: hypothetical protein DWQ02_11395 [Bacteroidota bacterium]
MKLNTITISLFLFIILIQSCQESSDIIFDLEQNKPPIIFQEEPTSYSKQVVLNAFIGRNELLFINASTISNFTADSDLEYSNPVHFLSLSYFKKHCISKNYLALTSAITGHRYINFHSTNEQLFFDEELALSINKVGGIPSDSTWDYTSYNTSPFDNTAINKFDKAILPVVKKTDPDALVFILFDLRKLVGSANPNNYNYEYNPNRNLPKDQYTEIVFPEGTTNEINRMESFEHNFLVSTAENTYLIRPDGSYQLLLEGSANDFFKFDDKIYADFGDRIAFSSDDGETWEVINDTPEFPGFREFQDVYGHLIFFHEDNLYLVNPDDFSYYELDNEGLEHSKITAVLPFYQRIFVTTLSGVFYKPIENLE